MTAMADFTSPNSIDLNGKGVLVTGGTGSFGKAFIRRVLEKFEPARLVIYSRDEQKQAEMAQEFSPLDHKCLRYFIGDVRDAERLQRAMQGIDIVVHAAAMKHVPIAEYNPFETIKTNVIGAENVVNVSIDCGVERVVALSTDKAANPVNLYGATKLCSDKLFVAGNNLAGQAKTKFGVVRYGNVLGSRGSIIPLFRGMVRRKVDALPITDERMSRFWITIEQGVDFVLMCLGEMQGGEIFVPKIPSMTIPALVDALAPGYPTKIVGLRPGEKLHETMITVDDVPNTLEFENCYVIKPTNVPKFETLKPTIRNKAGTSVEEGFQYRSDLNGWWLDAEGLHALLATAEPAE
ncbi:MAG: UDP-N-acetylglucosamine 4,6-dehydratase (inverting) [Pseudomonadota bacterium]|nr:UDP-N-acetylglucosamine 4,6-dehydratase (inverting) [Pseudomonadota bacterium]